METSTFADVSEDPKETINDTYDSSGETYYTTDETYDGSGEAYDPTAVTDDPTAVTDDPPGECDQIKQTVDDLFIVFLLVSVGLTFVLSFIVRRKRYYPNCLWGRPGILQPVNFVDEVYRRWAYAACFVLITNDILTIFLGESKLNILRNKDKAWMKTFGFVRVFVKLLDALAVSLVYYPLLACINHRRYIAANVIGTLYLIPWIAFYSQIFYHCKIVNEGSFNKAMDYITTIPMYISFYVIGLSYVLDLVANIKRKRKSPITKDRSTLYDKSSSERNENLGSYPISHHFQYVGNLLRVRKSKEVDETKNGIKRKAKRVVKKAQYEKIMGFRYSTRLVCCTATSATMIIWVVLAISSLFDSVFSILDSTCKNVAAILPKIAALSNLCEYMHVTGIVFHLANGLAGLIVLIFMVNTLVTYKQRWHQLLRGDHSWHIYGKTMNSPPSTLLNGLKYAGFQVAYAAWGWVVLALVLFILLMFAAFAFIIPLMKGQTNQWFITLLRNLWPTVLLGIIIALIQKLICQFLFLQDKGSVMALNNRRMYNAASYYFLVLNVIIGFFSCLKRILIPLVLGILFLSRLDQPLIMKGYETKDPGYVSFVSMLLVDLYHNHPVVKAFVELMLQVRKQENTFAVGVDDEDVNQKKERLRRSKMIRNRWWKTITLANNPSLVLKALEQRLIDERNNALQDNFQSPIGADGECIPIEMQWIPENEKNGVLPMPNPSSTGDNQPAFLGYNNVIQDVRADDRVTFPWSR